MSWHGAESFTGNEAGPQPAHFGRWNAARLGKIEAVKK